MLDEPTLARIGSVALAAAALEQMLAYVACRICDVETPWEAHKEVLRGAPGAVIRFKRAARSRGDRELKRLARQAEKLLAERGRLMHSMTWHTPTPDGQTRLPDQLLHLNSWQASEPDIEAINDLAFRIEVLTSDIWRAHNAILNAAD